MRVAFLVQAEGRGHLTQALAVAAFLRNQGMELVCVVTGNPAHRTIPQYFSSQIQAAIYPLESLHFEVSPNQKGIHFGKTLLSFFRNLPRLRNSVNQVARILAQHQPDLILNFYEPLGTLFRFFNPRNTIPMVCIGHQYLQLHPDYPFPPGNFLPRILFRLYTRFTCAYATAILGLSWKPYPTDPVIGIIPPLLRPGLNQMRKEVNDPIILAYLVLPGFIEEILILSRRFPEYQFHVFSDKPYPSSENIHFHLPDDRMFKDYLSRCSYYLSTAGFESVCEALYLGRNIFLVPVQGQYEQQCNAYEFESNPGIRTGTSFLEFDPGIFPGSTHDLPGLWFDQAEFLLIQALNQKLKALPTRKMALAS